DFEGGEIAGFPNEYGEHLDRIEILNPEGVVVYEGGECATYLGISPAPGEPPACPNPIGSIFPVGIIEVNDFIKITFWDPSIAPVPPGDYTLIQHVSAERESFYDDHPYGAWLGYETTCHGGKPMIGSLHSFEEVEIEDPILGDTIPDYEGSTPESAYNAWWNDVVRMNFQRRCSGDRGNICSGPAGISFMSIEDCWDMNEYGTGEFNSVTGKEITEFRDYGEVESCSGPSPVLINPIELVDPIGPCTGDDDCIGECIEGLCYPIPVDLSCHRFTGTAETPISFETVWNLPRIHQPDTPATGICNPNRACGDTIYDFDPANEDGALILSHATCNNGVCSLATESANCERFNGFETKEMLRYFCDIEDLDPSYGETEGGLFTSSFHCVNDGEADCDIDPETRTDPDDDPFYCEACDPRSGLTITMPRELAGGWTGTTCCGDDYGEGGFPYGTSTTRTITSRTGERVQVWPARRTSTIGATAGRHGDEICDDYIDIGNSGDYFYDERGDGSDPFIDNDCDGQQNCWDTECYNPDVGLPKTGVRGGYCCKNLNSVCLDTFESHLLNTRLVSCVDQECKCNNIRSESICTSEDPCEVPYSALISGFTTCVPLGATDQKYIQFTDWPTGTTSVNVNIDARINTMSGNFCNNVGVCIGTDCNAIIRADEEFAINKDNVINFKSGNSKDCHLNMIIA
ncbi:hypothetical protein HQ545_02795, partial [Candidatus Woesearchaeota archaeon]|nr:hypothetical protein [Candidatus Woesearchaeota archaeon]